VWRVPNQPATQVRGFRLPDDLWEEIKRVSADRGETATDLAIRALWREVRRWPGDYEER
jgi:muconolactone delta-isomerase